MDINKLLQQSAKEAIEMSNIRYDITCPFPPSVNTVYTIVRNRKILSAKGRKYKEVFKTKYDTPTETIKGAVRTTYTFYRGDARKYDVSNFIKTVEDCLTEAKFWEDDYQVTEVLMYKMGIDRENPRVEVIVEEIYDTYNNIRN